LKILELEPVFHIKKCVYIGQFIGTHTYIHIAMIVQNLQKLTKYICINWELGTKNTKYKCSLKFRIARHTICICKSWK